MTETTTAPAPTYGGRDFDAKVLLGQIGGMNLAAIDGGRTRRLVHADNGQACGVLFNVGRAGWRVVVKLADDDTYTVQRVQEWAGKQTVRGEVTGVYADEVGERAYEASCFVNVAFGAHKP